MNSRCDRIRLIQWGPKEMLKALSQHDLAQLILPFPLGFHLRMFGQEVLLEQYFRMFCTFPRGCSYRRNRFPFAAEAIAPLPILPEFQGSKKPALLDQATRNWPPSTCKQGLRNRQHGLYRFRLLREGEDAEDVPREKLSSNYCLRLFRAHAQNYPIQTQRETKTSRTTSLDRSVPSTPPCLSNGLRMSPCA